MCNRGVLTYLSIGQASTSFPQHDQRNPSFAERKKSILEYLNIIGYIYKKCKVGNVAAVCKHKQRSSVKSYDKNIIKYLVVTIPVKSIIAEIELYEKSVVILG